MNRCCCREENPITPGWDVRDSSFLPKLISEDRNHGCRAIFFRSQISDAWKLKRKIENCLSNFRKWKMDAAKMTPPAEEAFSFFFYHHPQTMQQLSKTRFKSKKVCSLCCSAWWRLIKSFRKLSYLSLTVGATKFAKCSSEFVTATIQARPRRMLQSNCRNVICLEYKMNWLERREW